MKHIEDYLKLIPETIWFNRANRPDLSEDLKIKLICESHDMPIDEYYWSDLNNEAYLAITTNSARYKMCDEGHWNVDLVCFEGDPLECTKQLYEWLVKNKIINEQNC